MATNLAQKPPAVTDATLGMFKDWLDVDRTRLNNKDALGLERWRREYAARLSEMEHIVEAYERRDEEMRAFVTTAVRVEFSPVVLAREEKACRLALDTLEADEWGVASPNANRARGKIIRETRSLYSAEFDRPAWFHRAAQRVWDDLHADLYWLDQKRIYPGAAGAGTKKRLGIRCMVRWSIDNRIDLDALAEQLALAGVNPPEDRGSTKTLVEKWRRAIKDERSRRERDLVNHLPTEPTQQPASG